jgi:hypothetical protein
MNIYFSIGSENTEHYWWPQEAMASPLCGGHPVSIFKVFFLLVADQREEYWAKLIGEISVAACMTACRPQVSRLGVAERNLF